MPVLIRFISRGQAVKGLDAAQFGPKAAHLAALARLGYAVPPAIAVSLPAAEARDPAVLDTIITHARRVLGANAPCCIRSSFLNEDLAAASMAGQYESLFGLRVGPLLRSGAAGYLERANEQVQGKLTTFSFLIQREVQADLSGIAFSQHPDPALDQHIAVQYVTGHGLGLTEGTRDPKQLILSRFSGDVLASRDKHAPGPNLIPPDVTRKLWHAARRLEQHWSQAVDIEFVVQGDRLYLLQARPVTALAGEEDCFLWSRTAADEFWSGSVSGTMWDSAGNTIHNVMLRRPLAALPDRWLWQYPLLKRHATRVYLNTEAILYVYHSLPGWARVRALAEMAGVQNYHWRPFPLFPLQFLQLVQAFFVARFRWLPWMPLRDQEIAIQRGQTLFEQARHSPHNSQRETILAGLESHLSQAVWGMVWAYILVQLFVRLTEMLRLGDNCVQALMAGNSQDPVFRLEQDIRFQARRVAREGLSQRIAAEYLAEKYGYLAFSRDIVAPRWYDNHAIAESLLQASPAEPMPVRSTFTATRTAAGRLLANGRVLAATITIALAPLTGLVRRWVAYREEMRLCSDRYLAALRLQLQHTNPDALRQTEVPSEAAPDWLRGDKALPQQDSGTEEEAGHYRGIPLYRGEYNGTCHVIQTPEDLLTFPDGAVLVSEYLDPSLGTLMSRAGGALFTYGGALSHGGILAREHQVPSLCGLENAHLQFPTGTKVTLDSRRGVVRILPE